MCEVFFFNDFQTSNVEKKLYTYIIIVCVYVKRGKFSMFQTFQELHPLIFGYVMVSYYSNSHGFCLLTSNFCSIALHLCSYGL